MYNAYYLVGYVSYAHNFKFLLIHEFKKFA